MAGLAIPPAWTEVWISPDPLSHIQATGRDARDRKQYRYHPKWSAVRSADKFERLLTFGRSLPLVRREIRRALRAQGVGRERVLAAVLALMDLTALRVGNDEYARENGTYGLTTLRKRHITLKGSRIAIAFAAKGGRPTSITITNTQIAGVIRACMAVPGVEVFKWMDGDGVQHDVKSREVNAFLREISGENLTAKDYRTWAGTLCAYRYLSACPSPSDEREASRNCLAALDAVAEELRNTRKVARSGYVHEGVLDLYCRGKLSGSAPRARGASLPRSLTRDERELLRHLARW